MNACEPHVVGLLLAAATAGVIASQSLVDALHCGNVATAGNSALGANAHEKCQRCR